MHQKIMQMLMTYQAIPPPHSPQALPHDNLKFLNWYKAVGFSVYRSRLDAFILNSFPALTVKVATDPIFVRYTRSLHSFLVVPLSFNVV